MPSPASVKKSIGLSVLLIGIFFSGVGVAAPYNLDASPESFGEAQYEIENGIPQDLTKAMCGGWDWGVPQEDETLVDPLSSIRPSTSGTREEDGEPSVGKIPVVSGVPGRTGNPYGQMRSGMAERNDQFIAPGDVDVCGFMSACRPASSLDAGNADPARFPPFYNVLSCQRPLGGLDPYHWEEDDDIMSPEPSVDFTCGGRLPGEDRGVMPEDGHVCPALTPDDGGLCWYMNDMWTYAYYEYQMELDENCLPTSVTGADPMCTITLFAKSKMKLDYKDEDYAFPNPYTETITVGNVTTEVNFGEAKDVRYGCTNVTTEGTVYDRNGFATAAEGKYKNCETCTGSDCRYCNPVDETCPIEPKEATPQVFPPWRPEVNNCEDALEALNEADPDTPRGQFCGSIGAPVRRSSFGYRSFFRHYTAGYQRDPVREEYVPEDDYEKKDIPVSCYRPYEERNPLDEEMTSSHKDCVIAAYYDDPDDRPTRNFWEMNESQLGHGEYFVAHVDIEDIVRYTPPADDEEDAPLWYTVLGNAFSLLQSETFEKKYENDISLALYERTDTSHHKATKLIDPEIKTAPPERQAILSSGALLNAFDDTANPNDQYQRLLTEWWQEIETDAHTLFAGPVIHVLLPAGWSLGLDPLEPIFTPYVIGLEDVDGDIRLKATDVQIHAKDDTIDALKRFLSHSLLAEIEEEPLPVLTVLGDPTDLRTHAEGWKRWVKNQEGNSEAVAKANALIQRLDEYAQNIDEVRVLRSEQAQISAKLFEHQKKVLTAIDQWLNDSVVERYGEFREQYEGEIAQMRAKFQNTQRSYRIMHDIESFPWCRNDRFTTPIYSLLDSWMEGRPDIDKYEWPQLDVERGIDGVFDFTGIKAATGALKFPVLAPIQVRIDSNIIEPPHPQTRTVAVPTLPPLPPVPSIHEQFENFFPKVFVDNNFPPAIAFDTYSTSEMASLSKSFDEIQTMINRMRTEYRLMWESITLENFDDHAEQDCYAHRSGACVHAEMDLLERITRIGARPALLLREDYYAAAEEFRPNPAEVGYGKDSCPVDDWACQLLHGRQMYPRVGWAIDWSGKAPEPESQSAFCGEGPTDDPFGAARVCLFRDSLQRPGVPAAPTNNAGLFPYAVPRNDIVESFAIPSDDIQLIPQQSVPMETETQSPGDNQNNSDQDTDNVDLDTDGEDDDPPPFRG
jgi:hypothetical protein